MSKNFYIQPHTGTDKEFRICDPDDFFLIVDYDDVDHETQDKMAKKVASILNKNWNTA